MKCHLLGPLLLNEYQKQYHKIVYQQEQISGLKTKVEASLERASAQDRRVAVLTTQSGESLERISDQDRQLSNQQQQILDLAARLARLEQALAEPRAESSPKR